MGYEHREEMAKHASQKDYAVGFGGKYGVQKDRMDASSAGYNEMESGGQHESQKREILVPLFIALVCHKSPMYYDT